MVIGTYILIITLNVNGLNAPTKRHRLAEWIQNKPPIYAATRDPLQTLNVNGLNAPTKRHRLAEWIQNKPHIYAATRDPLQT